MSALARAGVALLLAASPVSARPSKARAVPPPVPTGRLATGRLSTGPGQVTYVNADGIFVDRGSADGLKVGDTLQTQRSGKPSSSCAVAAVSQHSAVCSGTGIVPGDRITIDRKPLAPKAPLTALPDASELAARQAAIEAATASQVDFAGGAPVGNGQASTLEVTLSHTSAGNFASSGGPYQLQRADAALRDLRLWRGLHASFDVTVLNWSRRPADFRSPLTGTPQLFVRQAELSWHENDGLIRAAVGRTWSRHTPGLSVIDGGQVGLRTRSGELEAGVFGGLLPDPLGLRFSTQSWAAGAYAFARFSRGTGADAVWVQPELRAGWTLRPAVGGRFEVAAAVHGWVGRTFDAHAMVQAGLGTASSLDVVRLDFGFRPTERWRFIAGARYRGSSLGEVLELGAGSTGSQALHADGQLLFDLNRAVVLALWGGAAEDFGTRLLSGRVGPELQLPTLFGRGGLSVGYAEELGWIRGRSAYVQVSLVPHWRLRLLGRGVWLYQAGPQSAGLAGHEVGGSASVDLRITSWLWVRVSGLVRGRLDATGLAATGSAQAGIEL